MIKTGFKTHRGMRRRVNEDACFVLTREKVYMVADGVGGYIGGQCASHTAVVYMAKRLKDEPLTTTMSEEEIHGHLEAIVEDANSKIREKGIKEGYNDMCTTLVMAVILDNRAYFVNAGDSRAYLLRQGKLSKITRDNSYVARLLEEGAITEEEAETHPKKNEITKALGAEPILDPDFYKIFIEEGDCILLCSDGLYKEVEEKEIINILTKEKNMGQAAKRLVSRANNNGGSDNITAVCIKWEV